MYLDYAATTPLDPQVAEAMNNCQTSIFGNPSSPHTQGRIARKALEDARDSLASLLNIKPQELIFTASGSESNTLAIFGTARRYKRKNQSTGSLILLSTEHSCSIKALQPLREDGWNITLLEVDHHGMMNPNDLQHAIQDDTALVSIQWANNEVGTIQPIQSCLDICREADIPLHSDAVQAAGILPLEPMPDMLSLAAHKFYGPKGIGALVVREHIQIDPIIYGGGQEFGLRAGTENIAAIIGMEAAFRIAMQQQEEEAKRLCSLRDDFIKELTAVSGISLAGHPTKRLPHNINLRFEGKSGQVLVMQLDQRGICAATGSACATGATEPSHVLQAMGSAGTEHVRFSIGRHTTKEDLHSAIATIKELYQQ